MPKLIITVGLSGSGKSTYAESLVKTRFAEINRDNVRFQHYAGGVHDWGLYKFTKAKEEHVSSLCLGDWYAWSSMGHNVIVSDTNLDKKYHNAWKFRAEQAGYDFEVKYFPITLEEAYKRDLRRGGKAVGRDVLNRQWKQWLKITGRKTYNPTKSDKEDKTHVILCDIDGTIAKMGDRGPFDWKKVGVDSPRNFVINLLASYSEYYNLPVIFLSGRDSVCMPETKAWLYNNLPNNLDQHIKLFMRKEGDNRKDSIIKEEIFWEIIKDYYVSVVFDDRPQVIRMWKDLGLNVVDVSEDYNEF